MTDTNAVVETINNTLNAVANVAATPDTHSMVSKIIIQLLIVFLAAKGVGYIFHKIKQPVVVGELLIGILLGPYVLNIIQLNDPHMHLTFEVVAEVAVIILLFSIGLETKISDMLRVGWKALWVALAGVIVPFALGFIFMKMTGEANLKAMFMGAVMVATSVGITARILKDLKFLSADVSKIILGAAVIDDILGLIVLSVLSGIAEKDSVSIVAIAATFGVIILFVLIFTMGGVHITKKYGYQIGRIKVRNAPLLVAAVVCFTFAMVANQIGLAAIVGAFMAGLVLAELKGENEIRKQIDMIDDLIVVFFFAIMGAKVNIHAFLDSKILMTGIIISALAFFGKYIACAIPVLKMGMKKASFIGMGMVPRGEVGIIIAAFALSKGIIDDRLYGIAIFMVLVTTFLPPFFLEPLIKSIKKGEKQE